MVSVIEATGCMGIYNDGYASVSKHPSNDYLDRVFVDMMWYASMSLFIYLSILY
jgi:hypothetical protein